MTERKVSSERVSEELLREIISGCEGVQSNLMPFIKHLSGLSTLSDRYLQRLDPATVKEMASELLALRSSVKKVGVKPLVWSQGWGERRAATPFGDYRLLTNTTGHFDWYSPAGERHWASTEDAAKAAAQADYEQRILSAIEAPVPVSEEVAEASCPGCRGTGDQGGNPSYGVCDDCNGTGKVGQPLPAALPPVDGLEVVAELNRIIAEEAEDFADAAGHAIEAGERPDLWDREVEVAVHTLSQASYVIAGLMSERITAERDALDAYGKLQTAEARISALEEEIKRLREIVKAVAHIGVDFGFGPYELEHHFIEDARQALEDHND